MNENSVCMQIPLSMYTFNYTSVYKFHVHSTYTLYMSSLSGGSHLSHTVVKPDSCLALIFCRDMYNLFFS